MKSEFVVAGSRERETKALMVVDLGIRANVHVCREGENQFGGLWMCKEEEGKTGRVGES